MSASCLLAIAACWVAHPVLPSGFWAHEVASTRAWETLTGLAIAEDGRWFVLEKSGRVHVVENGLRLPEPFLDLEAEVLDDGDRGLLGIALDPHFAQNGFVYVLYTVDPNGDGIDDDGPSFGRLTRFTASAANRNVADLSSRRVLLGNTWSTGIPSLYNTHTIGCLRFGLDGSLLVSAGDGAHAEVTDAGGRDPAGFGPGKLDPTEDIGAFRSQWLGSLAGKILRVDPATGGGLASNPFYTGNPLDNASRVWAYGLRNPFRFAVEPGAGAAAPGPASPGLVVVGDVGSLTWEELDSCPEPGANFGWPCNEGPEPSQEYRAAIPAHDGCEAAGAPVGGTPARGPAAYWHHTATSLSSPQGITGKAAAGAVFYRGSLYPAQYRGVCFYCDYTGSWIRWARFDAAGVLLETGDFATDADGPVDLATDPATGDLCFISIHEGKIWRIRYGAAGRAPAARASADPTAGDAPLAVRFSSAGTTDPDGDAFQLLWQFGDGTGSTEANPVHVYTSVGSYTATLTATDERGKEGSATLTIDVGGPKGTNRAPEPVILEPLPESRFLPDAQLVLRATAMDAEDAAGLLDFTWEILLHHNTHVHPGWLILKGPAASFLPGEHDDGTGTWLECVLRVKDTQGLTATRKVSVFPESQPIVMDTGDPGTSWKGSWLVSGGVHPHGPDSLYSKTAGNAYSYLFNLPAPGVYRVYAWWTAYSSRPPAAPYTIDHASGSETVFVDQRTSGEEWHDLGPFVFGSTAKVTITAVVGGFSTCADAILLLAAPGVNVPPTARIESVSPVVSRTGELVTFAGSGEDDGTIAAYRWDSSLDGLLGSLPTFTTRGLSIGAYDISFSAKDDRGLWSKLAHTEIYVLGAQSDLEIVLDNGGPGTSFKGSWKPSGAPGAYGTGSVYTKIATDSYDFQTPLPQPGAYEVFAWWTQLSSRAPSVSYRILTSSGEATTQVDQRSNGGQWMSLGTYLFGGSARVSIPGASGGFTTCADAVRFVLRGDAAPQIMIDNGGAGTSATGNWIRSGSPQPYGANSVYLKGAVGSYTYSFTLPGPGTYEMQAWWTSADGRATNVTYTVQHASGTTAVQVNQRVNGGQWRPLGKFAFSSSGSVRIDALPDGKSYCADAILLRRVGD